MFLMIVLTLLSLCSAQKGYAAEATLGDIRDELDDYFEENQINIDEGTEEYYLYCLNQLMYEDDEKIKELPDYETILDYMSLYMVEYELWYNNEAEYDEQKIDALEENVNCDKNEFFNKTIEEASSDLQTYYESLDEAYYYDGEDVMASSQYDYVVSEAKIYAATWALNYNTNTYKSFSSDCTNFVSQCLIAGDILNNAPSSLSTGCYETTSYWYHTKANGTFCYSTSFIRVADFNSYWKNRVTVTYYSSRSTCASKMKGGDVVILARASTGAKYHAIFIMTGGTSATYCGHTNNRYCEDFSNISDSSNTFYRYRFSDFS